MDQIHPYLSTNHDFTVFGMLAEHLNSCFYAHNPDQTPSKEEYGVLLRHLVQPLYTVGAEPLPPSTVPTSTEFAAKYHKQLEALYQKHARLSGFNYIEAVRSEAERYIF